MTTVSAVSHSFPGIMELVSCVSYMNVLKLNIVYMPFFCLFVCFKAQKYVKPRINIEFLVLLLDSLRSG